jgi:hypothetical protein
MVNIKHHNSEHQSQLQKEDDQKKALDDLNVIAPLKLIFYMERLIRYTSKIGLVGKTKEAVL